MVIRFEATLSGVGHSLIVQGFPRYPVLSLNSKHGFVFREKRLFEFDAIGTSIRLMVRESSSNLQNTEIFDPVLNIYEIGRSGVWEFDDGGNWTWLKLLS